MIMEYLLTDRPKSIFQKEIIFFVRHENQYPFSSRERLRTEVDHQKNIRYTATVLKDKPFFLFMHRSEVLSLRKSGSIKKKSFLRNLSIMTYTATCVAIV